MFQDGSDKTISSASLGKGGESARQTPDPLRANFSLGRSPHPRYWAPKGAYHPQAVFLDPGPTLTSKAETPTARAAEQQRHACAEPLLQETQHASNQTKQDWFYSVPFQRFQALLTLFSKSFSPFPHGTCFLSVSNQYLALDEIYHQLCAPIPRNVTLRKNTVCGGLQMTVRDSHPL